MMYFSTLFVVLFCITVGISASPIDFEPIDYETAKNLTADYCYAKSYDEVASIVEKCKYIALVGFEVPAGKALELNLKKNSVVLFEKEIKFGVSYWDGPLVRIKGDNIQIIGGTNHLLHGQGEYYWDGQGGSGGHKKPDTLISLSGHGGIFKNINIKNCPTACIKMIGTDLTFTGINIDLNDGFKGGLAKHTDAITMAHSSNILIENSKIINQDDCVNIMVSSNAVIRNVHCWGSHGLTISAGLSKTDTDNDVRNITYEDCSIGGSFDGIHVKTHPAGGHGTVDQITYRNVYIKDVTRDAIHIQQDYPNGDGHPSNNIKINNLNLHNVTGTMTGKGGRGVRISCGSGSCTNWNWSGVKITGTHQKDNCNFHPHGYSC